MNHYQVSCQRAFALKTLLLGLFACVLLSCTANPKPKSVKVQAKSVLAEPVWFNAPERFAVRTPLYDIATHAFFDLTPFRTKESADISYFLTTPVGSAHQYDLDLVSGQIYRRRTYCSQKDIWEAYEGKIDRPNFSIGVIPRLLDQASKPQMIWVFGDKKYLFDSEDKGRAQSQRATVIGGFVWQYCEDYPCRTNQNWLSRLVLVGVNKFDPNFSTITNLSELKKKVNWPYVKAFAQNGWGRNVSGTISEPAYRMVGEVSAEEALNFAFKAGHFFSFKEINSLRKNCFYLYDYLWRSLKKVRKNMSEKRKAATDQVAVDLAKEAKRIRELKEFALSTVISDNTEKEIKKNEGSVEEERALVDFGKFFQFFYKRYGERFRTCSKFVKAANQRHDPERFWFFSYLKNWFHLEDMNYYYLCPRRSWLQNPRTAGGRRRFDLKEKRSCSSLDLDESFEQGVTVMASIAGSDRPHWRFLEFDNGIGGSHKEIYSWVFENGKKLGCDARSLEEKETLFPQDISWKPFYKQLRRGRYDIIR